MKTVFYFIFFFSCFGLSGQALSDSVSVSGRVTDYDGNPLDSVSVTWYNEKSSVPLVEVFTDKNGYYQAKIKKGRYFSMGALNMSEYCVSGSVLPKEDQRLEFWCWNFIADRDTTFNMQYHRMEVYGINVFRVQGGMPGYTIYLRPMSLTRFFEWQKKKAPEEILAPSPDKADVKVMINGEDTPIRMIQEVKEYFEEGKYGNAYLLFVDLPEKENGLPYDVFRIKVSDLENGDKGEAAYFLEKKGYVNSRK